jgi:multiple sugar transport system permease protein
MNDIANIAALKPAGSPSRVGAGKVFAIVSRILLYAVLAITAASMSYTAEHYIRAMTRSNFDIFFKNSLVVSLTTMVLNVLVTALAGYAFARLKWRLREVVFMIVLSVMMLPGLIALIPTFLIVKTTPFVGGNDWLGQGGTGWLDSYAGLIFPSIGSGFYVFLFRQFFLTLPSELEDAGRIDGCSEFSIFWRIMLPLCKPVLAVVALFTFQSSWNDFLWPLVIVQSDQMRTIQLGLTLFRSQNNIDWGVLMAGTTIATFPTVILFLSFQRYFVQGIALTGITA